LWLDAFAMIRQWAMTYMGTGRLGVIYSVYSPAVPVWHISKSASLWVVYQGFWLYASLHVLVCSTVVLYLQIVILFM